MPSKEKFMILCLIGMALSIIMAIQNPIDNRSSTMELTCDEEGREYMKTCSLNMGSGHCKSVAKDLKMCTEKKIYTVK